MRGGECTFGRRNGVWPLAALALLFLVLLTVGCQSGGPKTPGAAVPQEKATPVAQPAGRYLDFDDVQAPVGLTLERDLSYVYQTANLKAGVLSFSTTLSLPEVAAFFQANMPRDNWTLLSTFQYGKIIHYYQKDTKICLILMERRPDSDRNRVEVWVSPRRPG